MSGNSMQSFEFCTGKKIFYPKIPVCISDKERRKYKYIEIGDEVQICFIFSGL